MKKYLLIVSLFVVSACSMKEALPLKTYTLFAEPTASFTQSQYHLQTMKIAFPQTLKEKITNKMYYSYSLSDRGVYQDSQWSNNSAKLIQGIVIQVLSESKLFKAVLPYASTAGESLRLESNIYDFSHHVRGSNSYAIVSIEFNLIDTNTGKLLKTKRFSYKENTLTTNAKGYVEATQKAMGHLSRDLVRWLR
jgi:cholesterol transport system auxiliary component